MEVEVEENGDGGFALGGGENHTAQGQCKVK